jgi:signal transduction histidine kinase
MADVSGGSIVWNLDVDTKKFTQGLEDAKDKADDAGKKIESSLSKMAGGIISGWVGTWSSGWLWN